MKTRIVSFSLLGTATLAAPAQAGNLSGLPSLPMDQTVYAATALLGVVVLHRLIGGKLKRRTITDDFPKAHQKLIIAMASAALEDENISDSELATIKEMLNRLSPRDYTDDEVQALVQAVEPAQTESQIRKLGKGLIETQKLAILKAAHAVAVAGKQASFPEDSFLQRLAKGLKLPAPEVQAVLAR